MGEREVRAAEDWAHDYVGEKQASRRSKRINCPTYDLVLAFMAGVSWERMRGLIAIRKRTDGLEREASSYPTRTKKRKEGYGPEGTSSNGR